MCICGSAQIGGVVVASVWHVAQLEIQRLQIHAQQWSSHTGAVTPERDLKRLLWHTTTNSGPAEGKQTSCSSWAWLQDALKRQERSLKCFSFLQKSDLVNSDKCNYQTTTSFSVLTCWTLPNPHGRRGPHSATIDLTLSWIQPLTNNGAPKNSAQLVLQATAKLFYAFPAVGPLFKSSPFLQTYYFREKTLENCFTGLEQTLLLVDYNGTSLSRNITTI